MEEAEARLQQVEQEIQVAGTEALQLTALLQKEGKRKNKTKLKRRVTKKGESEKKNVKTKESEKTRQEIQVAGTEALQLTVKQLTKRR